MIKKIFCSFIITAVVCFLLLVFVYLLPVDSMMKNARASSMVLTEEGIAPDFYGVTIDTFTDAIMIGEACYQSEFPAVKAAMESGYNKTKDPIVSLDNYTRGNSGEVRSYARYWHGYLLVLKPLLMLFSYQGIRILNYIVISFAVVGIGIMMFHRKISLLYYGAFVLSLLVFGILILPCSLQLSNMYLLMFVALLVMLCCHKKLDQNGNYLCFFLIVGMLSSYFDFLTVPVITLGIPLLFFILLKKNRCLKEIIGFSILWGIGYGLFWSMKWILSSVILGRNVLQDAMDSAAERSSMSINDTQLNYREVLKANLGSVDKWIWFAIIFLIACLVLFVFIQSKKTKLSLVAHIELLFVSLIPFGWYLVFSNHSFEHNWFTYRNLLIFVMGLFFYLIGLVKKDV